MSEVEQLRKALAEAEKCLAHDREVFKELVTFIMREVPQRKWPLIVMRCASMAISELLFPSETEPPTEPEKTYRPGWDDEPLLGKVPDTELAKKHGVSEVAVGKARKRRGIPPFTPKGFGGKHRPPGQRAGIDWDKQPLGKVPDCELAKKLGVKPETVLSARKARGIERCYAPIKRKVDWDRESRLGRIPDIDLAKALGVHRATVKKARDVRGIPRFEASPVVVEVEAPKVSLSHVHKCPVCFKTRECEGKECEPKLEAPDGRLMLYETCQGCVDGLAKESSGVAIGVLSNYFNHGRIGGSK